MGAGMKFKRVLLKLSGEALAGDAEFGLCPTILKEFCSEIKSLHDAHVQVGVVIGGGNIHRGATGEMKGMNRTTSDHMGMLATIINALALQDTLERMSVPTRVMSAIESNKIAEPYIRRKAVRHLEKGRVLIFAAGTGNPYFTTDTAAALRANEIGADVILKATKVDGVYDKDPMKHKDAKKFDVIKCIDALKMGLKVMDSTALSLCMDNNQDIIVFDVFETGNILKVVKGEKIGTLVTNK